MALHIIEKAETGGAAQARRHHRREHLGQHRDGRRAGGGGEGLPLHLHDAGQDVAEKINRLKALGAQVVVTPTNVAAEDRRSSYYETAKRIARETPGSFYLNQYHNPDNIEAHYLTTGPEIWEQTGGQARRLRRRPRHRRHDERRGQVPEGEEPGAFSNVGVDPVGSSTQGYFKTGKLPPAARLQGRGHRRGHALQGDGLLGASTRSARSTTSSASSPRGGWPARRASSRGGSSGAAVHVAVELAKEVGKGKMIVVRAARHRQQLHHASSIQRRVDEGQRLRVEEKAPGRVSDLHRRAQAARARSREKGEKIDAVVEQMRKHGISQMPVRDANGGAVGMIHEYDLLNALVAKKHGLPGRDRPADRPAAGRGQPRDDAQPAARGLRAGQRGGGARSASRWWRIVTKIDLIEYLAGRM